MSKTLKSLINTWVFLLICLATSATWAQSKAPSMTGGVSFGTIQFNPLSPNANEIKMNNGLMVSLMGQKRMGFLHLYLAGSLDYSRNTGSLNYNFLSPTSVTYVANNTNYTLESYKSTMALRLKIIENFSFRPYIEGGASLGYDQFAFDNSLKTPAVLAAGSDYKMLDSSLEFGTFGEAGVEADLGSRVGLNIGVRYSNQVTRTVETLNRRVLTYSGLSYLAGLYLKL